MPLDPTPASVLRRRQAIGAQIRDAREHANLTQIQLGEIVGVDHKTIHRYEYATAEVPLSQLILIADAVGVPISYLVRE